jgi:cytoskeletal protein CcmA (bactofilin family)
MALSDFTRGKETSTGRTTQSGAGPLTAFIDQGSEFTGRLSFKDTVRIDGHFEGEITSENTLIVGETGQVHANIRSATVVISGEVCGDIVAPTQLIVRKTGRVMGNVIAGSLLVEEGSEINGLITMGSKAKASMQQYDKDKAATKKLAVLDPAKPSDQKAGRS